MISTRAGLKFWLVINPILRLILYFILFRFNGTFLFDSLLLLINMKIKMLILSLYSTYVFIVFIVTNYLIFVKLHHKSI